MLHILNLFCRSPFAPLQGHMEKVAECVDKLEPLFQALKAENGQELKRIAAEISALEHGADIIKSDIRNHLPSSLFLSIDRNLFLQMLSLQDSIADCAEDIAVLATLRPLELLQELQEPFEKFLNKNVQCFREACKIIQALHELLESSFGGTEAERVKAECQEVAFIEHEADVIQRELLRTLFTKEEEISYAQFMLWQKIFEAVGSVSNFSEQLANCVRMTLDIK